MIDWLHLSILNLYLLAFEELKVFNAFLESTNLYWS